MKVSFGGNQLIITNNAAERDSLYNHVVNDATHYHSYLYKVDKNKVLIIDGKESEDVSRLKSTALSGVNRNIQQKAIINGYKDKAIIIDIRDNAYTQTQKYHNNKNKDYKYDRLELEDIPLNKNNFKPDKRGTDFPYEIPENPSPQKIRRVLNVQ